MNTRHYNWVMKNIPPAFEGVEIKVDNYEKGVYSYGLTFRRRIGDKELQLLRQYYDRFKERFPKHSLTLGLYSQNDTD